MVKSLARGVGGACAATATSLFDHLTVWAGAIIALILVLEVQNSTLLTYPSLWSDEIPRVAIGLLFGRLA